MMYWIVFLAIRSGRWYHKGQYSGIECPSIVILIECQIEMQQYIDISSYRDTLGSDIVLVSIHI